MRPDPHVAFGWVQVPVTSLNVVTAPCGAPATYPDQFELTSGAAANAPPATASDAATAVTIAIDALSTGGRIAAGLKSALRAPLRNC